MNLLMFIRELRCSLSDQTAMCPLQFSILERAIEFSFLTFLVASVSHKQKLSCNIFGRMWIPHNAQFHFAVHFEILPLLCLHALHAVSCIQFSFPTNPHSLGGSYQTL